MSWWRIIPVIIMIVLLTSKSGRAQDPHFTQFYANPVYLNPAMTGVRSCPSFTMNYRNQWPGIRKSYITYASTLEKRADRLHGGVGLSLFHDRAGQGSLQTTAFNFIYAYHAQLNRSWGLRVGVKAGYVNKSVDWSKLVFGDMIDDRNGVVYSTNQTFGEPVNYVDFSAGSLLFSEQFYIGFAVDHLTRPAEGLLEQNSATLPMRFTAHAGGRFESGSRRHKLMYSPGLLVMKQAEFLQYNVGLYVTYRDIVLGGWYRGRDAAIILLGIETEKFKLGYSYDMTVSPLLTSSLGSHEISYTAYINCGKKTKRFSMLSCPVF